MLDRSFREGRAGAYAAALTAVTAALLTIGSAQPATAAAPAPYDEVGLTASPISVEVGDIVEVRIDALGVVDAYAYQLGIDYDPQLLEFIAGSGVFPAGGFGSADAEAGVVDVIASRLGTSPGLAGDQMLVSLEFTALAPGDAVIALSAGEVVDSDSISTAVDTSVAGLSGMVTIAAVDGGQADADADAASGAAATGSADGAASAGSADAGSGGSPGGGLASTGADAGSWWVVGSAATVLIAAGVVLALGRRRVAR